MFNNLYDSIQININSNTCFLMFTTINLGKMRHFAYYPFLIISFVNTVIVFLIEFLHSILMWPGGRFPPTPHKQFLDTPGCPIIQISSEHYLPDDDITSTG